MVSNFYSVYWPPEALDAIKFIHQKFHKDIWMLGVRALYAQGVPVYRGTEDIDIYSPITKQERDELTSHLRRRYGHVSARWTSFGVSYTFPSGYKLDVNITNKYIKTQILSRSRLRIGDTYIYVPSTEDVLILKLLAPQEKHLRDVRHTLRTLSLNIDLLLSKAKIAGVEKKLLREIKVVNSNRRGLSSYRLE